MAVGGGALPRGGALPFCIGHLPSAFCHHLSAFNCFLVRQIDAGFTCLLVYVAGVRTHLTIPRLVDAPETCLHCNHTPEVSVKARLVRIGNSRGLRLAKPLIEQLGFEDEVELSAEDGALVIRPSRQARVGWADAAARLAAAGESLIGDGPATRFDDEEWEWR